MIVSHSDAVTLVGGARFSTGHLTEVLTYAPYLVAADGGARAALRMGHIPQAVIGDFDSLDKATIAAIPPDRLHRITEQDSTDFDKCLRSIRAPLILGLGFAGGRLDHELAAYNALVRHPGRPCILIGPRDICFHIDEHLRIDLARGSRVSLFPMAEVTAQGEGLEWALDGAPFRPWGRVGTSNRATRDTVDVRVSGPGMLAILPRKALPAAITALLRDGFADVARGR